MLVAPLFAPQLWRRRSSFVVVDSSCRWGNAPRQPAAPHHIAERYGLLTLIVRRVILSATSAVQSAMAAGERLIDLVRSSPAAGC